jgi:hypothetical protein
MPNENEIVIRRDDLPKADREFGITEKDRDLSEAKVLIEGIPAVRLRGDEDSVTVIAPADGEHDGPLQIVVTTSSDKPVGILNYWWNGQEWEFQKPDPNGGDETEDGLSPVVKAIGDVVAAIKEFKGKK